MRFGSVCSGIEAASVAFAPLGWKAAWLAEIDSFPSSVLAHHYPAIPNLGDMTRIAEGIAAGQIEAPDLLCGGTPCQSFSVAGLRKSLSDARGNLSLEFIRIADAIDRVRCAAGKRPAYVLWENVPGVLSTKDNAFGAFLGGLCGGDSALDAPADGWPRAGVVDGPTRVVAWRVLDAQFFGLAQRRQRVFVLALGGAGKWACADALLPIADSLQGHPAPSREARQGTAGCLAARAGRGFNGQEAHSDQLVTHALTGEGFDASEDGTGRGTPLVPVASIAVSSGHGWWAESGGAAQTLRAQDSITKADTLIAQSLRAQANPSHRADSDTYVPRDGTQVRRLTPRECERLQGFPDGYTAVAHRGKPAADGPRYKALGNSWAVPCMRWIGERIGMVEAA